MSLWDPGEVLRADFQLWNTHIISQELPEHPALFFFHCDFQNAFSISSAIQLFPVLGNSSLEKMYFSQSFLFITHCGLGEKWTNTKSAWLKQMLPSNPVSWLTKSSSQKIFACFHIHISTEKMAVSWHEVVRISQTWIRTELFEMDLRRN